MFRNMKSMLAVFAAAAVCGSAFALSPTDTFIADFESIPSYNGAGTVAPGDTAVISTVPGVTRNAMQVAYDLKGNAAYTGSGYRSWGLPSPCYGSATNTDYLDLSGAQGFSFQVKVETTQTLNNSMFFYVTDSANRSMRMSLGNMLTDTAGAWRELRVPFATQQVGGGAYWPNAPFGFGLQSATWYASATAIDLANVKSVTMGMYDTAGTTEDRNVTFAFDDLYAYSSSDFRNELATLDFNAYADEAAMKAEWVLNTPATSALGFVTCSDGKKAATLTDTALTKWTGRVTSHTLATAVDLSLVSYVNVELEGDATYAGYDGLLQVMLEDANGKLAQVYLGGSGNVATKTDTYGMYATAAWAGNNASAYTDSKAWRFGTFGGNATANNTFNLAAVKIVGISMSAQRDIVYPVPAPVGTVKIRKITFGTTADLPNAPIVLPNPSTLEVTLTPAAAVTAGAKVSIDGGLTWLTPAELASLAPGSYTVKFSAVAGYKTPADKTIWLKQDSSLALAANYDNEAALTVTLTGGATGAQWSVDNGATWKDSGISATVAGSAIVKFKGVTGFVAPVVDGIVVATPGETLAKSYAYAAAPVVNDWKAWGAVYTAMTTGSTVQIASDKDSNLYLFGYGQLAGSLGFMDAAQTDAAATVFAPNGNAAPTSIKNISPRIRYNEGWAPLTGTGAGTQQGTNGTRGVADPLTGKVFINMDGNPGSPSFTVLMDANGTTDTVWNNGLAYEYPITVGGVTTPRYQATAADATGVLYLGELFCASNPTIRVVQRDGSSSLIKISGMADHIRAMAVKKGTNGAVTLWTVASAYGKIYRVDANMNDLAKTYAAVELVSAFTPATTNGHIFYNPVYNTLMRCDGTNSRLLVVDADTGVIKQTLAGMTSMQGITILNNGADNQTAYMINANRQMIALRRSASLTVTGGAIGRWSIDNGTTWRAFGTTLAAQNAGDAVTIKFEPVAGYATPADRVLTLKASGVTSAAVVYGATASVKVDLAPAAAVAAGAKWSVDSGATWNDSGATATAFAGASQITFKHVANFVNPNSIKFDVAQGETKAFDAAYLAKAASPEIVDTARNTAMGQADTNMRLLANGKKLITAAATNPTKTVWAGTIAATTGYAGSWAKAFELAKTPQFGNNMQGLNWTKDKTSFFVSGDVGDATVAPAVVGKMDIAADGTITKNATYGTGSHWYFDEPTGHFEYPQNATYRRGTIAVLSDGRVLGFGLGHAADPHTPRYDVIKADGSGFACPTVLWTVPAGFTAASTVRSAVTKFGAAADGSQDIVFVVKDGQVLKMTATNGDWTQTPTVVGFFAPGFAIATDTNVQISYDEDTDDLYLGVKLAAVGSRLYKISASDATAFTMIQTVAAPTVSHWANAIAKGDTFKYLYVGGASSYSKIYSMNGELEVEATGAVPAGAAWSIDGGTTWNDFDAPSGGSVTPTVVPATTLTVTFKPVPGYFTPAAQTINVVQGAVNEVVAAEYEPNITSVTVNFNTADIAPATGGWMLMEGAPSVAAESWFASGHTELDVVGDKQYSVVFKSVAGWEKPADILVHITSADPIVFVAEYKKMGKIVVTMNAEGAEWKIVSAGIWHESGHSINVTCGFEHVVSFSDVDGYITPADVPVTLTNNGEVKAVVGKYVPKTGAVSVTITPAEAVAEGAKWSIDGGAIWHNSGATAVNVFVGEYTVTFKAVDHWVTPAGVSIDVAPDATTEAGGLYERGSGVVEFFNF